jgi:hypothetical protein
MCRFIRLLVCFLLITAGATRYGLAQEEEAETLEAGHANSSSCRALAGLFLKKEPQPQHSSLSNLEAMA